MSAPTVRRVPAAAPDRRGDVLAHLARPSTPADRRRTRLVAAGVAGAGAFLLAVPAILGISGDRRGGGVRPPADLAPFVAEAGLRTGTAFATALMVIPFLVLAVQALRTGTAARERRLAALSLAGATRRQLRKLAVLEGTRAAALGSLLAGPAHLVLWVVLGVLPPPGARLLPDPGPVVLVGWLVLIAGLTAAGAAAAGLAARPATVSPLGITRRAVRGVGRGSAVLPVAAVIGAAALAGGLIPITSVRVLWVFFAFVLVLTFTAGPWLVRAAGLLAVRADLPWAMAGHRLLADLRSPGRVAGVLFATGVTFGAVSGQLTTLRLDRDSGDHLSFYVAGELLTAGAGLLAAVVACFSLVVGATEQVLDSRRGTAVLVALAASPAFVVGVVRRQLLLAAVPAAMVGAALGWVYVRRTVITLDTGDRALVLLSLPVGLLVAGLVAAGGALLAARAVAPAVRETSGPENLRAP